MKIAGQALDQRGESHVLVGFLVFLVAQDGARMATQWTRSWWVRPVSGFSSSQASFWRGIVESLVVGDGVGTFGVVSVGRGGAFASGAADAFEGQVDAALDRDGAAGDDGPVGFLNVAAAEQGGELAGGAGGAGKQQHAGGVAVESVDEARPVLGAEAKRVQHPVKVAGDAGAALHRQAVGLVNRQDLVVLVDDCVLQVLGVVGVCFADGSRFGRGVSNGGMRMDWPGVRRVLVSARAPSTRIWPVRQSFWIRLCWVPG